MRLIGHHTCDQEGTVQEIEEHGPFLSTHVDDKANQHKFLGTGYYFWDNNIKRAHIYGQSTYRRRYYIFESKLDLDENQFLDLAGNRIDMIHFQEIMEKLREAISGTKDWTLAHFIEFLKKKGAFQYRAVRALDINAIPAKGIKFVADRENYTNLNPVFIVCLSDTGSDIVNTFRHLKTFPDNG